MVAKLLKIPIQKLEPRYGGKMECRTSLKILGIGEAKWPFTNCNKRGQRANLGTERTKKQAAIAAAYSHEKSALHRQSNQNAGKLYEHRISHSFMAKVFVRRGRGFPLVCSDHGTGD
jgi:hypothetical protein